MKKAWAWIKAIANVIIYFGWFWDAIQGVRKLQPQRIK